MRGAQEIFTQSLCHDSKYLWPTHLFDIKKMYVLTGNYVFDREDLSLEIEANDNYIFIPQAADASFIEGIYNRETGMTVFNEQLASTAALPTVQKVYIDVKSNDADGPMIRFLQDKENSAILSAKEKLALARYYNDGIRKIHDASLDQKILKEMENDLTHTIFDNQKGTHSIPLEGKAYFGCNGIRGPLYMTQFQNNIDRCFILKGQGASIPSKILESLAMKAGTLGFNTLVYYCPFYPDEIDCLIIPEINTMIIDSEPPHEFEPLHPHEIVLNFGDRCRHPETLFVHSQELKELEAKYKQYMRQAMLQLADYRKYKRQELHQTGKNNQGAIEKVIELLNGSTYRV